MQADLRARLLADSTIGGLVSTRVDWGVRPQGKPLPAITLTLVSDNRDQTMAGLQATQGPLIQVDCWAETYTASGILREAVVTLLATPATQGSTKFLGAAGIVTQDLPEKTDTGMVFRSMIRATVWHTI
jgi:hypothetical protein